MYDIDRFCIVTSIILSRLFKKIIRVFLGILVKQSTIIKQILFLININFALQIKLY